MIEISRVPSTRKFEGTPEYVYEIWDNNSRVVAPTARDLLLEVARAFRIPIRRLELMGDLPGAGS